MTRSHRTEHRAPIQRAARGLLLALSSLSLASCTIVKYVDEPKPPGPNNGLPDPKIVDALVLVDIDRTTATLAPGYERALGGLTAGLESANVEIRKLAVAPMYRRTGGITPLIWGKDDPDADFDSFSEAIAFFALDDGQRYLRESVDAEGESLAALGLSLSERAIYHPESADAQAVPYFIEPSEGFIVVTMSAQPRLCGFDELACQLDGERASDYFAAESGGEVDWLRFHDGAGLRRSKVVFVHIATAEGVSEEAFFSACGAQPGFNGSFLDMMSPGGARYFEPLGEALFMRGVFALAIDMCEALSAGGPAVLSEVGAKIATQLRREP